MMRNAVRVRLCTRGGTVYQPNDCELLYPKVAGTVMYRLSHRCGRLDLLDGDGEDLNEDPNSSSSESSSGIQALPRFTEELILHLAIAR